MLNGVVGGVVLLLVLVLVCGFGTGTIVMYQMRRWKVKRQSEFMHSCHAESLCVLLSPSLPASPPLSLSLSLSLSLFLCVCLGEVRGSVGRGMVHNPMYSGSGDIYEEIPEDTAHPRSGVISVPNLVSLPPSIPPPRNINPTEELSESEKEAIEAKLKEISTHSESQDAKSQVSSCCGEEVEDCYTVMSPAGTLTVLPRNRHSGASITANGSMAGTL